jgi:hypothetical protein
MTASRGGSAPRYIFLRILWLWGCAFLCACGGKSRTFGSSDSPVEASADTTILFASGTRLKARVLDAGGGARKLLGFYDSVLDIECRRAVYAVEAYCDRPAIAYLLEGVVNPCQFSVRVQSPRFTQAYVADPYSGPVFVRQSGDCRPHTDPPPSRAFYAPGERVSPEAFPLVVEEIAL